MAKMTDTEIYTEIRESRDFRTWAKPLLESIPKLKEAQDAMITANEVSEATKEEEHRKIARYAVTEFQKSTWYRVKQIATIGAVILVLAILVFDSIGSNGKIDTKQLAEALKEILK